MAQQKTYSVLFYGYENAARSIMGEAIMERWSQGRFKAFSAGVRPGDALDPLAVKQLKFFNHNTDRFTPKGPDQFLGEDGTQLDFVFTVSERASNSDLPAFAGYPMSAFWGTTDPTIERGDEMSRLRAYRRAYLEIESRVKIFVNLRVEGLDRLTLQEKLHAIGRQKTAETV